MSDFTVKISNIKSSVSATLKDTYAEVKELPPRVYGKAKDELKATANKVHSFVQDHRHLVRTALAGTCMTFAPIPFAAGFLTPTILKLFGSRHLLNTIYPMSLFDRADQPFGRDLELGATVACYFAPFLLPFVAYEQGIQLGKLAQQQNLSGDQNIDLEFNAQNQKGFETVE